MSIARHGSGPRGALRALASQVHPVFMLPPLACSLFGGVLAGGIAVETALVHVTAVFAAVYTAHVKDGYVDFFVRGEDDDHPLTERGCRLALASAGLLFLACLGALYVLVGAGAVLVTVPTWLIGYHHAPQLDTNPVTATTGYPAGIAVAIAGGYYVQAGALAPTPLAFGAVFLAVLSGVKVIDDAQDFDYDQSIDKRTVAVVLGQARARTLAYGLMAAGLLAVLVLATVGPFPPSSALAVAVFGVVAVLTRDADPTLATMILVRGSYLFLVALILAAWIRPLG